MTLAPLMTQLAARLQLDDLPLSDDGCYRLILDDDLLLRMTESPETGEFVVLCELLSLPAGDEAHAVMRMLLGANYRWAFSARGHFAAHPQTGAVEYALREPLAGLDIDRLESTLQAVGAVLTTVKREVREGGLAGSRSLETPWQSPPAGALSA